MQSDGYHTSSCVFLPLMAGTSAGYDRQHPVRQLRPQDQLHHRCLWDETRRAEEGKTERWPLSALIHHTVASELIKRPVLYQDTANSWHTSGFGPIHVKIKRSGRLIILNDLLIFCSREQNSKDGVHMCCYTSVVVWGQLITVWGQWALVRGLWLWWKRKNETFNVQNTLRKCSWTININ